MLLEALASRSRRGIWLALQPTLIFGVLLVGIRTLEALLPLSVAAPAGLLAVALWCRWAADLLARRAEALVAWLRQRVVARGGDGDPRQPIRPPDALETNARNAPAMLASLEAVQLSFMRRPGQVSHRVLALAALALWAQLVTRVVVETPGVAATASVAGCTIVAGAATIDLYRGRRRDLPRLWQGADAPWPAAWAVADRPSKVLGPIWLALAVLFFAATVPISHASSIERGISIGFYLSVPLTAVWMGRYQLGWISGLGAVEQTGTHRAAARWLVRLAPMAWWSVLLLQATLTSLGIAFVALSPIDDSATYLGVLVLGIAIMVRAMRIDWQRPRAPTVVDLEDVASLLGEPHLERRVTRVLVALTVVSGIWFYLLEIT